MTEASNQAKAAKPGLIAFVAAFSAFLATFNETFLNVGFTPIMNEFAIGDTTVQWRASFQTGT